MARTATKAPNKVRLNLEVSPQVRERLLKLKELADADSMSETIRRALTVYELVLTAGGRVYVESPDGSTERIVIAG